jgi:cell division protein FtsN
MADPELPEIPASGRGRAKQLVFYSMAALVVAVAIFLLGVSVGKGVRSTAAVEPGVDTSAPTDTTVATNPTPVPSTPTPTTDLNYHPALQGQPETARKPAAPPPPAPAPATPPVSESPAAATGGYDLQVAAFRTLEGAEREVAQLKAKQYTSTVLTLPDGTPPPRFKVMVGPFKTAAEANAMAARLKQDGYGAMLKKR